MYDLLKDSRGYIWMAHDFGLTRYDGRNFVSFGNPRENAVSVTDLWEDAQNRIWCHNFSGQIFFVDGFQMHLLDAYRFDEEPVYPRIGICGDELVATSAKGVFVLNTKTFAGHYYLFPGGSSSLSILDGKVLLYGKGEWHLYIPNKGLVAIDGRETGVDRNWNLALQPHGLDDTAFLIHNPEGDYYKLFVTDNRLHVLKKASLKGYINAITLDSGAAWIHTRSYSVNEHTGDTLAGLNITDIVRDNYGNFFAGSLKSGLLVRYNSPYIERLNPLQPDKGDFIRTIQANGAEFVCGTQKGKLLLMDAEFRKIAEQSIPGRDIPIEFLYPITRDEFIAGTTIGAYWFSFSRKMPVLLDKDLILKDIIRMDSTLFLATNKDMRATPLGQVIHYGLKPAQPLTYSVVKTGRTRALGKGSRDGRTYMYCSFGDGVWEIAGSSMKRLLYNGVPVYATSIRQIENKTIIGTFDQGILILEDGRITSLTDKNGLLSNSIKNIKITENGIWVISFQGFLQKLDAHFHIVSTPITPFRMGVIYDLEERDRRVYIATNNTLYKTSPVPRGRVNASTSVDFILVNGKDTAVDKETFAAGQNNLQINLSTPFFNQFYFLRYKYRFRDKKNSEAAWSIGDDDQKSFSLVGLRPGHYVFEARAINPIGDSIARPVVRSFEIRPAWYQTGVFTAVTILLSAILVFVGFRLFFLYRLREQRVHLEREIAVERERRRISEDLHDDIGSTLSSINIYTGLAKKAPDKDFYFDSISQNVNSVIEKLDELVWSINPRYDTLEDISNRLIAYAEPIVKLKGIDIQASVQPGVKHLKCPQELKHHVYMCVKELINNAIKHSGCSRIELSFSLAGNGLLLRIQDDGIGFSAVDMEKGRNGIDNIARRMNELKGTMEIGNQEGGGMMVIISIPV